MRSRNALTKSFLGNPIPSHSHLILIFASPPLSSSFPHLQHSSYTLSSPSSTSSSSTSLFSSVLVSIISLLHHSQVFSSPPTPIHRPSIILHLSSLCHPSPILSHGISIYLHHPSSPRFLIIILFSSSPSSSSSPSPLFSDPISSLRWILSIILTILPFNMLRLVSHHCKTTCAIMYDPGHVCHLYIL